MAIIKQIKSLDYTDLGLKTLSFTPGDVKASIPGANPFLIEDGKVLQLVLTYDSGELLPVGAKVAMYVHQKEIGASDNRYIVEGIVQKIDKISDYQFKYTFNVDGFGGITLPAADDGSNIISEVTLLDYDHYIMPVDKNGVTDYITYYFDNSQVDTLTDSSIEENYWDGSLDQTWTTANAPERYKGIEYPIVNFFDRKYVQTIENDAIVWVRRKAKNTNTDTITYLPDANNFTIDAAPGTLPSYDNCYYVQVAEERLSFNDSGDMTPCTPVDFELPSTTAKFIGWPRGEMTTGTDTITVVSKCDPYFFLKPSEDAYGADTAAWDADEDKKHSIVINGAHQISPKVVGDSAFAATFPSEYKYHNHVICAGTSDSALSHIDYTTGGYSDTDWSSQRVMSLGGSVVPGDGNEFYNISFSRNDGVTTEGVLKVDTRQGIIFDNCDFLSQWDGKTNIATGGSIVDGEKSFPYIGTSTLGPAVKLYNTHDIIFRNCDFKREAAYVLGAIDWVNAGNGTNDPTLASIVVGKDASYGRVPTVDAKNSGNLTFIGCSGENTYGQSVYQFNDVDNLDMETCTAETYYHGTPKGSREVIDKPIGYLINDNSTSMWLKGCSFYGEGIGFYAEDMNEMVYPLMENCSSIANGEEAYYFRNVKFPKLRNCKGETISRNVFLFEGCEDPILYNCTAESDTGYGFAFNSVKSGDYSSAPTRYWRTNDCHILSGSGLTFDEESLPGKIDIGTFIQTANIYKETYGDIVMSDRSLVGLKLWDAPYKTTIRNMYFKNILNDIDIDKGPNVELYLENTHFAGIKEIKGEYNSPAYFIHKGFSGVWEYRDIGGSITTSAVKLTGAESQDVTSVNDSYCTSPFSLSFKSSVQNELGRPSITLGNSNEETQYLDLVQGWNKITIYAMGRLLDVENPITDLGLWAEVKYKDRSPGDPHIATMSTRGKYNDFSRLTIDNNHQGKWVIQGTSVPDQKAYKIDMFVKAGQDCSAPLTICYEYYTTVGEVYVSPYARVVNPNMGDAIATEIANDSKNSQFVSVVQSLDVLTDAEIFDGMIVFVGTDKYRYDIIYVDGEVDATNTGWYKQTESTPGVFTWVKVS